MSIIPPNYDRLTEAIAMQCSLVGALKRGQNNNIIARVAVVNVYGDCIFDTFVYPTREVLDYRSKINGFTEYDLKTGIHIQEARKVINYMLSDKSRILVGHNVYRALSNLGCGHPDKSIREITDEIMFQTENGVARSLKSLSSEFLGLSIPNSPHNLVADARCAIRLYIHKLIDQDRKSDEEEYEEEYEEECEEDCYYSDSSSD